MNNTYRKLIVLLGLAGSLSLPGLALADNGRYSPKFSGHQQHEQRDVRYRGQDGHNQYRQHDRYRHDERRHYNSHHQRHDHHRHGHHYAYRVGHYHGNHYCALDHGPAYHYGYYPGAYMSGVYVSPSVGLHIDLR